MRILVTGGSGFIGTNLIQELINKNHILLNIDILAPRNPDHAIYWKYCNILDQTQLKHQIQTFDPEVVFHLAARTDLHGKSLNDYSANTDGVKNILKFLSTLTNLRQIILASSRLVCKIGYSPINEVDYCPTTYYGESKVIGEKIARSYFSKFKSRMYIVRPTSIWGPWFGEPYKNFFLSIARNQYFHPGNYKIFKSFGYVGNTVFQMIKLIQIDDATLDRKSFYLADDPPTDIFAMANLIQSSVRSRPIKSININILRFVAFIGDILKFFGWSNPPLTSFRLNNLITEMIYDLSPIIVVSGPLPFTLSEGVQSTVDWMNQYPSLNK